MEKETLTLEDQKLLVIKDKEYDDSWKGYSLVKQMEIIEVVCPKGEQKSKIVILRQGVQ